MRLLPSLVAILACVSVEATEKPAEKPAEESIVEELNDESIRERIGSTELMMVNFYAPWCHHCKNMKPGYEEAAKILLQEVPPILLTNCDATKAVGAADHWGVTGYPDLRVFRKGVDTTFASKSSYRTNEILTCWLDHEKAPSSPAVAFCGTTRIVGAVR